MDFIYSRLNNNLVDINKVKSLTLFKCTQDNVPIDGIKAGYFYLELDVVDSDRKVYCDLSDFIDNRLPVPNQSDVAKALVVAEDGTYVLQDISLPSDVYTKEEADAKFQDKLVSGVNIKTISGKSVLGEGNLIIDRVPLADNLYSSDSQAQEVTFIERTSGGDVSIDTGTATLLSLEGASTKPVHIEEQLNKTVWESPRFTATFNFDQWLIGPYRDISGDYKFIYNEETNHWQHQSEDIEYLAIYGIEITSGSDLLVTGDYVDVLFIYNEEDPSASAYTFTQHCEPRLTVTLDRDIWVSYVDESGTYTFYYNGGTSNWRLNNYSTGVVIDLADYGITTDGIPADLDHIQVNYVKADFGTIYNATPTSFNSTGFNLFNYNTGWAKIIGTEEGQWYNVKGEFTSLEFYRDKDGEGTPLTLEAYTVGSYTTNNAFPAYENGWVKVIGGNDTDTMINLIWSGYMIDADYEPYENFVIDIPTESVDHIALPIELCHVGITRDKIDLTALTWTVNVEKVPYTAQTLADLLAEHPSWEEEVEYEWDNNYIYYIKANPITYNLDSSISNVYNVNDFGIEYFEGTNIPVLTNILYGQNLKDKLRTDVLTISPQTLNDSQKRQVWINLGLYYVDDEEF